MITKLTTEQRNPKTYNIDELSTKEIVSLINQEDQAVIKAVEVIQDDIAEAIDVIYEAIRQGGRLIYIGAGTSGRLGVLDASEWFPTYGVGSESVLGIIAGGDIALRNPVEGAEDFEEGGKEDLVNVKLTSQDVVLALASSGRTPYCIGGLKYARSIGCKTVSLANVENSEIGKHADYVLEAVTGPEVVTGSTRMKAGSAQKMILNIISTTTMIKSGKVYGNLMVDVNPSNEKLINRSYSIIMDATGVGLERSQELLELANHNVKAAIVMQICNLDYPSAQAILDEKGGRISDVVAK